jgi:hypothetical protein
MNQDELGPGGEHWAGAVRSGAGPLHFGEGGGRERLDRIQETTLTNNRNPLMIGSLA